MDSNGLSEILMDYQKFEILIMSNGLCTGLS